MEAMEAVPAPDMRLLQELLAPPCLDPQSPPGPSAAQKEPRPLRCLRSSRRSLWPACQNSISTLCFLQETEEGLARPFTPDAQALRSCWEPMALGNSMARNSKNSQTPTTKKCRLEPPRAPPAPPQKRSRKQPKPCPSAEKVDPGFEGVTLKFQLQKDSSLQIIPTYSLTSIGAVSQGRPASPVAAPQPNPGGSEALGPRRCASCRTQRTPLWRDAEDGTPLCNACGIRYKKYGMRCSRCWLVPRKSVQPKRLCGRCGVSLDPLHGPTQKA